MPAFLRPIDPQFSLRRYYITSLTLLSIPYLTHTTHAAPFSKRTFFLNLVWLASIKLK